MPEKEICRPFSPPFCPNRECPSHAAGGILPRNWCRSAGWRSTKCAGWIRRFRCRLCRIGFSERTFDIDYWTRRPVPYRPILDQLVAGSGQRQTCRTLGVSWSLLANRHQRLARQCAAVQSQATAELALREDLVLDGFESFAGSQYFPDNLNLLVGADSQFVWALNAAVLRRKGTMRPGQKAKRRRLEALWKAPSNAIYKSSRELLDWACRWSFAAKRVPAVIRSDRKREYARALADLPVFGSWLGAGVLVHRTVSSKAARTLDNPLFAVNYLDRQLRKDLAEHVRETVRFARRLEFSLERALIHLTHHNFFKRFRTRSDDAQLTHAEQAGLSREQVVRLRDAVTQGRVFGWREDLPPWSVRLWLRQDGVPLLPVRPLARHLMTA